MQNSCEINRTQAVILTSEWSIQILFYMRFQDKLNTYHIRAIITRGLHTFHPLFKVQKRFFQGSFFLKFWPYVWLVFKSGF